MQLTQINDLYTRLVEVEDELRIATSILEAKQLEYTRLAIDLGDILSAAGLKELRMGDGREIGLKENYFGSASQERMPRIREFLCKQGSEGMLKPKKLKIDAEDLADLPDELKGKVEYEINTNTLKAFLRELAAKGELTEEVRDLFNVIQQNEVILK